MATKLKKKKLDPWLQKVNKIDKRVAKAIKASGQKVVLVDYSAYDCDENDEPIDNLDEIAVKGKVVLIGKSDEFFGGSGSEDYRSEVLENPTWLQVAVCANAMIQRTRDEHHVFLEGLTKLKRKEAVGYNIYEFDMGS